MEAEKCQIFKTFYVNIFVVKSILFQLLLRFMCSDSRFYFISILQNISVSVSLNENMSISVSISVNEYNTALHPLQQQEVMTDNSLNCQSLLRFYQSTGLKTD